MSALEVQNRLRIPVFFFTLLLGFQMITGFLLFHIHLGWSKNGILNFYRALDPMAIPMSFSTFLETASPHLLSMGMISFLVIHFLTFVSNFSFKARWIIAVGLAFFTFLDIFAGIFILFISTKLWWIKIFAFWGFQFSFLAGTLMMLLSLIPSRQLQSVN